MKHYPSEVNYRVYDIIVGYGHLVAVRTDTGVGWVLPGNTVTTNHKEAKLFAAKMDKVIQFNVAKFNRSLI